MTDYTSLRVYSTKRRKEAEAKWHNIAGIIITAVLLLAVFSGFAKNIPQNGKNSKSSWDGESAFSTVLNTDPISIFVYNPASAESVLVILDGDLYIPTGDEDLPIGKIADAAGGGQDSARLTKTASKAGTIAIVNYVIFKNNTEASEQTFKSYFKSFASLATPVKIAVSGPDDIASTNIARSDAFRLWWQLKGINVNNLTVVNAGDYSEEIVLSDERKVLGVDEVSMHRLFSKYMENRKILEEGMDVKVTNATGDPSALNRIADFVTGIGGRVGNVDESAQIADKTVILAKRENSYTAVQLAKIFNCDIKALPQYAPEQIQLVVGADFLQRF